ncbi:hypothetical protein BDK89_1378 [Ilumatobacter fluminis]|uniref:Uncharacterized protein n=1 Tax=Ilumatobacter fluminis TaxID=467091 RepID=A0A4R7HYE7_9ACTN|nr:hypothetical protein [Ilumatobacter fluminis]TDT15800.1 hypothetical protein BDK89_1378 [Ilumatobacter fluminis]
MANRPRDRWTLAAALLGLVAVAAATTIAALANLESPWGFVAWVGVAVAILMIGTVLLVPSSTRR